MEGRSARSLTGILREALIVTRDEWIDLVSMIVGATSPHPSSAQLLHAARRSSLGLNPRVGWQLGRPDAANVSSDRPSHLIKGFYGWNHFQFALCVRATCPIWRKHATRWPKL